MICKWCGKEFDSIDHRRKFCSDNCREEYGKDYRKQYWLNVAKHRKNEEKPKTKICLYCGEEFEPEHYNAKNCCLYCKKESHKQKAKKYYYAVAKPKKQGKNYGT